MNRVIPSAVLVSLISACGGGSSGDSSEPIDAETVNEIVDNAANITVQTLEEEVVVPEGRWIQEIVSSANKKEHRELLVIHGESGFDVRKCNIKKPLYSHLSVSVPTVEDINDAMNAGEGAYCHLIESIDSISQTEFMIDCIAPDATIRYSRLSKPPFLMTPQSILNGKMVNN